MKVSYDKGTVTLSLDEAHLAYTGVCNHLQDLRKLEREAKDAGDRTHEHLWASEAKRYESLAAGLGILE